MTAVALIFCFVKCSRRHLHKRLCFSFAPLVSLFLLSFLYGKRGCNLPSIQFSMQKTSSSLQPAPPSNRIFKSNDEGKREEMGYQNHLQLTLVREHKVLVLYIVSSTGCSKLSRRLHQELSVLCLRQDEQTYH